MTAITDILDFDTILKFKELAEDRGMTMEEYIATALDWYLEVIWLQDERNLRGRRFEVEVE